MSNLPKPRFSDKPRIQIIGNDIQGEYLFEEVYNVQVGRVNGTLSFTCFGVKRFHWGNLIRKTEIKNIQVGDTFKNLRVVDHHHHVCIPPKDYFITKMKIDFTTRIPTHLKTDVVLTVFPPTFLDPIPWYVGQHFSKGENDFKNEYLGVWVDPNKP